MSTVVVLLAVMVALHTVFRMSFKLPLGKTVVAAVPYRALNCDGTIHEAPYF